MPLRIPRAHVGVDKEAVAYTFNEPAAAQCFYAHDIRITTPNELMRRTDTRNHMGKPDGVPGVTTGEIAFKLSAVGAGAAGSDPYYHQAMMGCALQRVTVAATSCTYKSANLFDGTGTTTLQPSQSYSACVWEDGVRYSVAGAMGNLVIALPAGKVVEFDFRFQGQYSAVQDDSNPTPVTPSGLQAAVFAGAAFTSHGMASLEIENMELDCGGIFSPVIDAQHAAVMKGMSISDRFPTGKFNAYMTTVAAHDFFGRMRSGATGAIVAGPTVGSAGNRLTVTCGRTQYRELSLAERDNWRDISVGFDVTTAFGAVAGDEFSIAWT